MASEIGSEQATRVSSFNGIDVYRIDTQKFKTSGIHFFFQDNLSRQSVTKNALLPAVMRRGSVSYPTLRDISMRLERLYGASFDCGVVKKGERHVVHFYTEFLSQRYIPDGTDSFASAFELLFDIITRPAFENSRFVESSLAQEKDNLRMLIESRVNDKMQYSVDRCLEETCSNEPFALFEYGVAEDIDSISSQELTNHYRNMIETYPLQVYLIGSITDEQVNMVTQALSTIARGNMKKMGNGYLEKHNYEPKNVTETMDITQGKLCLGFRTNTAPDEQTFPALMMYNSILGGGVHSKLFQNVREKASLAYYSYSRLEKFKGLMVISSGIEMGNKDKTLEIIMKQMDEMKKGNISDYEMETAAKSMETGLKSLTDSQISIVDFHLSQSISGTQDSFSDIIEKIKRVKRNEIIEVADKILHDTVYFLTAPAASRKENAQ
ncbi:MAG: insulinase family protein [Clostridiaceae bacterium]|jgi:predicted Zn-dependent peptidase|nr:insulinase family protein [Clostridiaceae bacterium]